MKTQQTKMFLQNQAPQLFLTLHLTSNRKKWLLLHRVFLLLSPHWMTPKMCPHPKLLQWTTRAQKASYSPPMYKSRIQIWCLLSEACLMVKVYCTVKHCCLKLKETDQICKLSFFSFFLLYLWLTNDKWFATMLSFSKYWPHQDTGLPQEIFPAMWFVRTTWNFLGLQYVYTCAWTSCLSFTRHPHSSTVSNWFVHGPIDWCLH